MHRDLIGYMVVGGKGLKNYSAWLHQLNKKSNFRGLEYSHFTFMLHFDESLVKQTFLPLK